jgi:hypothetical protein
MKCLALLCLAACTSSAPDAQTQAAFFQEMSAMQSAQSQAVAQANQQAAAPYSGSLNGTYTCATGGSIALSGTYTGADDGTSSTYDLHDTLSGCAGAGYTIDGEWDWNGTYAANAFHDAITGTTKFTFNGETHTIAESLTVDLANSTFTMSGSITIDGETYSDFGDWSYGH